MVAHVLDLREQRREGAFVLVSHAEPIRALLLYVLGLPSMRGRASSALRRRSARIAMDGWGAQVTAPQRGSVMKIVVFGLTVSSSWGNGHATLWRGLIGALAAHGTPGRVLRARRALLRRTATSPNCPAERCALRRLGRRSEPGARRELSDADVAIVTSFCPDGVEATELILDAPRAARRVLRPRHAGHAVPAGDRRGQSSAIGPRGLRDFDLVLSYTGGAALDALKRRLGARRVAPLYGHVDPGIYRPADPDAALRLRPLLYRHLCGGPAARRSSASSSSPRGSGRNGAFVLAGAQYPPDFPWTAEHPLRPPSAAGGAPGLLRLVAADAQRHAAGHGRDGLVPVGRLFEAAACGAAVLSDGGKGWTHSSSPAGRSWSPRSTQDVLAALDTFAGRPAPPWAGAHASATAGGTHLGAHAPANCSALLRGATAADMTPRQPHEPGGLSMWGIVPAAGRGSRIQPLAFSKELLPVGSRLDGDTERPCAVSEYLVERMLRGGADKICFVISPGKSDILEYYGARLRLGGHRLCRAAARRAGCATRSSARCRWSRPTSPCIVGLPDTVWFPEDALAALPDDILSFLLFPVERPELFDAVVLDRDGSVPRDPGEAAADAGTNWIWGAFKMPGRVLAELARPLGSGATGATNISARWSMPGSPKAAAPSASRPARATSTSARSTAIAPRSDCSARTRPRAMPRAARVPASACPEGGPSTASQGMGGRHDEPVWGPQGDGRHLPAQRAASEPLRRRTRSGAASSTLGPWFHNIDLDGVETAPEHFLGDYPSVKWRGFADALPPISRARACSISAAMAASTRSR